MTNKKILTLITLLLFLFLLVGCDWLTPNRSPEIKSVPVETATVGVDYTYNVVATDPDGDALTYSLVTEPPGMLIGAGSGKITWTPPIDATVGDEFDVTVQVKDEEGLSDTQDFTITISERELVGIEVDPGEMTLPEKAIGTFKVTANYNDVTFDGEVTDFCDYGSSNNSVATVLAGEVTAVAEGIAIITVTYEGETDTIDVTVTESKSLEIIADDLLTFTVNEEGEFVDEEGEFTVSLVANSDVNKKVLGYFTLPPGTTLEYYEVDPEAAGLLLLGTEPGWYPADVLIWYPEYLTDPTDLDEPPTGVPTDDWKEWVFGPPNTGSPLCDISFDFRATFTTAGTYPTLVGVWEVTPGTSDTPATQFELLGYKLITFEVVPVVVE